MNHSQQRFKLGLIGFFDHENMSIDTFHLLLACLIVECGENAKNEILVMAALSSILLEMPKGDAMSSTGFSIGTTWATRICKEKTLSVGSRFTPSAPGLLRQLRNRSLL